MKISKEKLKKIIKEEYSEIDEAFFDKLLGKDTQSPPMRLRKKIDLAKESLKDLYLEAAKQKEDSVAKIAKELLNRLNLEAVTKLGKTFRQAGEFASYMEEDLKNTSEK